MADTVTEIGEIVKKCKILLLDIEGTTTSITFVKDKLFPYAEEHVKQFLTEKWESDDVKQAVTALRLLAVQDLEASVDGVVSIPGEDTSKDEQIEALVNSVKWQMSLDRKSSALKLLQGLIWKQGYDNGDIKGHVYDDVPAALENWRSVDGRKVYIYSSGSVQAQELLFGQSSAGDLRPSIDGHFDTAVGAKQVATSYTAIAEKIGCKPDEILFLTDIEKEAEAAKAAGLQAALVSREGNAPLADSAAAYPLIHSLAQLMATNKRKQDTDIQEENPAKVAKTTEEDIKAPSTEEQTSTVGNAPESMDVEAEPTKVEDPAGEVETKCETEKMQTETVVEEVTEPDDMVDVPMTEVKPAVIEDKDTPLDAPVTVDTPETIDSVELSNEQANKKIKETETLVLTEIEEITTDKPVVDEAAEIVDDLEPIVEEPDTESTGAVDADLDNLKNVGQVLEKECDEILSKVHDVTNLDSITVKPMLNAIAEENPETDIADSDDIVDRILDTELEFDMKSVNANGDTPTAPVTTEVGASKSETKPPVENVEPSITDIKSLDDVEPGPTDVQPSSTAVESSSVDAEASATDLKPSADANPTSADVHPPATNVEPVTADGEKSLIEEVTSTGNDEKLPSAQPNPEPVSDDKTAVTSNEEANTTNGEVAPATLNGDDVSSRLAMENGGQSGDGPVNGADGAAASLNGAGDGPDAPSAGADTDVVQTEVAATDIKVKPVPTEETHTDPTDQTTEA